ncbi:DNA polymerase beta domain protein region [Cellulomonas flavigena DSM 20109]|uniref:DNA polymerase beta domain protein region n=1 Tax=Cellulomonas flavigena (strain ATCC 482 / DSM 20109 / BCRC 11376 / JCM 18109 / NBRC 3775 / NCIMB 8073 / NRS 134) TaxID=446466 RepID=D5UFD4_CELFN|nr:nucleotidyltransferase family protein [Cellulomonas flavigena]ADG74931.1 DNA polymerase beta domain protein region [Cellulomonas flavigena DSM 20109]
MIRVDVRQHRELVDLCARYGFARLEVFGSVARGEDRADSDIDVLYDLLPARHVTWEIVDAAEEMSQILGRPVDLVSRRAVHPLLRERIETEAQALYAA